MFGLHLGLQTVIAASGGGASNWILAAGFWNDSGTWDDTATWID